MPKAYEELRIRIWSPGAGRGEYFVLANGPACAAAAIDLEGARDFHGELNHALRVAFREASQDEETPAKSLQDLGEELGRLLLPPPIANCYIESLRHAKEWKRGLRLRFDLPPELTSVPIELLRTPAGFVALDPDVSIVRSLSAGVANPMRPFEPGRQLTIMLAGASPRSEGYADLGLTAEIAQLTGRLRFFSERGTVKLRSEANVTRTSLADMSRQVEGHFAVMLASHGEFDEEAGEGLVVLETENHDPDRVSAAHLPRLLAQAAGLRLVVLNLCKGGAANPYDAVSGVAAQLIATGVPIVVAFQFQVSDSAARAFGRELLFKVCSGCSIDEACGVARTTMGGADGVANIEWSTPMVYLHEHCHQTRLLSADGVEEAEPAPGTVEHARWVVRRDRQRGVWLNTLNSANGAVANYPGDAQLRTLQREASIEVSVVPAVHKVYEAFCSEGPAGARARLEDDAFPNSEASFLEPLFKLATESFELDKTLDIALEHERKRDWDWAMQAYEEVLSRRPHHRAARSGLERAAKELRTLGGYVYDLFVSYAHEDFEIVRELVTRLQDDGIRVCFRSKPDAETTLLDETLERCRHTLVCLSDAYCAGGHIREEVQVNYRKDPLNERARTMVAIIRGPLTVPAPPRLRIVPWLDLTNADTNPLHYQRVVQIIKARRTGPGFPSPSEIRAMQALDSARALQALRKHATDVFAYIYEKKFGEPVPALAAELSAALSTAEGDSHAKNLIESIRRYSELKHQDSRQAAGPGLKALLELVEWAARKYGIEDFFAGPRDPFEVLWQYQVQELGQDSDVSLPDSAWELAEGSRRLTVAGALYRSRHAEDGTLADVLLVPVDRPYGHEIATEIKSCESLKPLCPLLIAKSDPYRYDGAGEWRFLVFQRAELCTLKSLRERFQPLPEGLAIAVARQIVQAFVDMRKGAPALTHCLFQYSNITLDRTGATRLVWNWDGSQDRAPVTCVREQFWFCRDGGPPAPSPEWHDWENLRADLCAELNGIAGREAVERLRAAVSAEDAKEILSGAARLNADDSCIVGAAVGCWFDREPLPSWMTSPPEPESPPPPAPPPPPQVRGLRPAFTIPADCLGAWPLGGKHLVIWRSNRHLALLSRDGSTKWEDKKAVHVRRVASSGDALALGAWEGDLRWFGAGKLLGVDTVGWTVGDVQPYGGHWLAGSWNGRLVELFADGRVKEVHPAPQPGVDRIATSGTPRFAVLSLAAEVSIYSNPENRTGHSVPIAGALNVAFAKQALVALTGEGLVTIAQNGVAGRPDRLPARGALCLTTGGQHEVCLLVDERGQSWVVNRSGTYPPGPWLPRGGDSLITAGHFARSVAALDGGGYAYWRGRFKVREWHDALAATISTDGRRLAVVMPDRVEGYDEDPA